MRSIRIRLVWTISDTGRSFSYRRSAFEPHDATIETYAAVKLRPDNYWCPVCQPG